MKIAFISIQMAKPTIFNLVTVCYGKIAIHQLGETVGETA